METIKLKPIGVVRTEASEDELKAGTATSEILLRREHTPSLNGLGDFSHLYVLFWMHKVTPSERAGRRKVHPWGDPEMPLVGVFATHSPVRPNPIALTLVELLEQQGNRLKVRGLDAVDGTPVLDIKPFDFWDAEKLQQAKVPEWWLRRNLERWRKWQSLLKPTQ